MRIVKIELVSKVGYTIAFAAMALLIGCGGGGGGTSIAIQGVGSGTGAQSGTAGGTGGGQSGFIGLDPSIQIPAAESYADLSDPADSTATKWLKNVYETLPTTGVYQNASLASWADQIIALTNIERAKLGLAPVARLSNLDMVAQAHARDMALRDYFAHGTPEGMDAWDRLSAVNAPATINGGENAAKGQENIAELIEGWMNSPGHRANIVNPNVEYLGVGVYFDPTDSTMPTHFIQVFAQFGEDPAVADWYERGDVYGE